MATEQVPASIPVASQVPPLQAWLARLGLSGKILAIGGIVGVIAVFLPLLSMSTHLPTLGNTKVFAGKGGVQFPAISTSHSTPVLQDWRGFLCLVGYVAALALAYVLYPANGLTQKPLGWAGLGVGAFITLLALWLVVLALNGSSGITGFGGFQIRIGIGAILNLLAGAAVATGGFLKAREEKLV